MKTVLIFLLALSFTPTLQAQSEPSKGWPSNQDTGKIRIELTTDSMEYLDTGVLCFVEQMPEFPGGEATMVKYIHDNLVYQHGDSSGRLPGKVVVAFIVMEDGSLSDIRIKKSSGTNLDNAVVEVVKSMPKWKPGKQNGKPVRVRFLLPISICLR